MRAIELGTTPARMKRLSRDRGRIRLDLTTRAIHMAKDQLNTTGGVMVGFTRMRTTRAKMIHFRFFLFFFFAGISLFGTCTSLRASASNSLNPFGFFAISTPLLEAPKPASVDLAQLAVVLSRQFERPDYEAKYRELIDLVGKANRDNNHKESCECSECDGIFESRLALEAYRETPCD